MQKHYQCEEEFAAKFNKNIMKTKKCDCFLNLVDYGESVIIRPATNNTTITTCKWTDE